MDFSKRLTQVIDLQYGGSRKKMSQDTGIPYSTLSEYQKGVKKDPKSSLLKKIKNVNTYWLITGEGEMLRRDNGASESEVDHLQDKIRMQEKIIEGLEKQVSFLERQLDQ